MAMWNSIVNWVGVNWSGLLNITLGAYGAVLTTYTIHQQRKDKKIDIKVSLYEGLMQTGDNVISYLFVKAANHGELETTLSSWQLVLPNKKNLLYPNARGQDILPFALKQKKSYQVWIPVKVVADSLSKYGYKNIVKVRAVYFDQIDNKYFSKKFEINIPEWKKE